MSAPVALLTNVQEYAGLPAALALITAGFTVVCHDRGFTDAQVQTAFAAAHPQLNFTAEQDPAALVETVTAGYGAIDVLVNNDSFPTLRTRVEQASLDAYRAMIEALLQAQAVDGNVLRDASACGTPLHLVSLVPPAWPAAPPPAAPAARSPAPAPGPAAAGCRRPGKYGTIKNRLGDETRGGTRVGIWLQLQRYPRSTL